MRSTTMRRAMGLSTAALVLLAAGGAVHAAGQEKKSGYGAIAYEPSRGAVGYAFDYKTSREARTEALKQCGDPACEVALSFRNACGAIARGAGKPVSVTGTTRDEAQAKALRRCGQQACEIVAWACTR